MVNYFIYANVPDNDNLCHKAFEGKNNHAEKHIAEVYFKIKNEGGFTNNINDYMKIFASEEVFGKHLSNKNVRTKK